MGKRADHRLLEIIACPVCNVLAITARISKNLFANLIAWRFRCKSDGIPVLLETEARPLALEESLAPGLWSLFLRVSPPRAWENHLRDNVS